MAQIVPDAVPGLAHDFQVRLSLQSLIDIPPFNSQMNAPNGTFTGHWAWFTQARYTEHIRTLRDSAIRERRMLVDL